MSELHNVTMKNAFCISALHHITFSTAARNRYLPSYEGWLWCSTDESHCQLWRERPLAHRREPVDEHSNHCPCLESPPHKRMVFCMNSNSTHSTFRKFMHWARPILRHAPFSVHGFYTRVSTIPNFLAAFYSRMRLSSLERLFWTVETANPFATQPCAFQERFGINVWSGIISGHLIGQNVLSCCLTSPRYLTFFQEILVELIADLPPELLQHMWWQPDGEPAHFSRAVREHLDQT